MNDKNINILDIADLTIILNTFENVDSVSIKEKQVYQIHIREHNYDCTFIVTIKDGIVCSLKLLNDEL